MSPQEALVEQERLFARALEIVKVKRADYSGSTVAFSNFHDSEFWGVKPYVGAGIRFMDKLKRFKRLAENGGDGAVKDETIEDCIVDGINYLVIVYLLWREQHQTEANTWYDPETHEAIQVIPTRRIPCP